MYNISLFSVLIVFSSLLLFACKEKSGKRDINKTDLLKFGIPYSLNTPSDVTISKIGNGNLADVSVRNQSGYDIQIFMGNAYTNDFTELKKQKKELVSANPFFVKIVEEYKDGFLYEKQTDTGILTYDFIIVKILGDKEISFQSGNSKEFSETEVKTMVKSIQD